MCPNTPSFCPTMINILNFYTNIFTTLLLVTEVFYKNSLIFQGFSKCVCTAHAQNKNVVTVSSQEGRAAHHQENGGNQTGPSGGDTGHLFLKFGGASHCWH